MASHRLPPRLRDDPLVMQFMSDAATHGSQSGSETASTVGPGTPMSSAHWESPYSHHTVSNMTTEGHHEDATTATVTALLAQFSDAQAFGRQLLEHAQNLQCDAREHAAKQSKRIQFLEEKVTEYHERELLIGQTLLEQETNLELQKHELLKRELALNEQAQELEKKDITHKAKAQELSELEHRLMDTQFKLRADKHDVEVLAARHAETATKSNNRIHLEKLELAKAKYDHMLEKEGPEKPPVAPFTGTFPFEKNFQPVMSKVDLYYQEMAELAKQIEEKMAKSAEVHKSERSLDALRAARSGLPPNNLRYEPAFLGASMSSGDADKTNDTRDLEQARAFGTKRGFDK